MRKKKSVWKKWILFLIVLANRSVYSQNFSSNCDGGRNIVPVFDLSFAHNQDWNLSFEDDFLSDSLDFSKWQNHPDHGTLEFYNEHHYSTLRNIEISGGILRIKTDDEPVLGLTESWKPAEEIIADGKPNLRWFQYTTAYLRSAPRLGFGYIEARCKIPKGKGFWPAMWLYGENPGPDGLLIAEEIDVFEFWKNQPDMINMNVHYNKESCLSDYDGPDYSKDFHIYGILWEPHILEWYVDGKCIKRYPRYYQNGKEIGNFLNAWQVYQEVPFPRNPLTLILNTAVDNRPGQKPDETTPFPSFFEIDWVRQWSRNISDQEKILTVGWVRYPNPTSGMITVQFENPGKLELLVGFWNSLGSQITEIKTNQNEITADLSRVAEGLVVLSISDGKSKNPLFKGKLFITR